MSPRLSHLLHDARHHAQVALVVASAILLLEAAGWLRWLDSLSLRLVSQLNTRELVESNRPEDSRLPVPLVISPLQYETTFGQRSPLAREGLAGQLENVLAQRPRALVVDIDLSPTPEPDPGQPALDALLMRAAAAGVPVTLVTPLPVQSEALLKAKYDWMLQLCRGGVRFGYPYVPVTQGAALRFMQLPGSVVEVARRAPPAATDPCRLVQQGEGSAAFLSRDFPVERYAAGPHLSRQLPMPLSVLAGVDAAQRPLDAVPQSPGALAGRVVYLGGAWDPDDHFATVLGPTNGVVLHAAAFAAVERPTTPVAHSLAALVDLVIGTLAGFLFHLTWSRYNSAARALAAATGRDPRPWLRARGAMLVNVLALLVAVYLVFSWSGWLLEHSLWNNPGPMLLGIFIKMAIASRPGLAADTHAPAPVARRFDLMLALPVVLAAAYLLFFGHH